MDKDYEVQIKKIKEDLEKAKELRYRAEVRLEHLNREKSEVLEQIKELGVEPDELEIEIDKTKKEIEDIMQEIKKMMPDDFIKNIEK